jgi:hypothetical protein
LPAGSEEKKYKRFNLKWIRNSISYYEKEKK